MVNTAKTNRRRSRRQESELAEDTGARVQRGSGALPWAKGDVCKPGEFRAECKFTKQKSFSLTRDLLTKIRSECSWGEVPIMDITFVSPSGQTDERFVVVPYSDWVAYNAAHQATKGNK